ITRIVGPDEHATVANGRRDAEEHWPHTRPMPRQDPRCRKGRAGVSAGERPASRLLAHYQRAYDVDERSPTPKVRLDRILGDPRGDGNARNDVARRGAAARYAEAIRQECAEYPDPAAGGDQ